MGRRLSVRVLPQLSRGVSPSPAKAENAIFGIRKVAPNLLCARRHCCLGRELEALLGLGHNRILPSRRGVFLCGARARASYEQWGHSGASEHRFCHNGLHDAHGARVSRVVHVELGRVFVFTVLVSVGAAVLLVCGHLLSPRNSLRIVSIFCACGARCLELSPDMARALLVTVGRRLSHADIQISATATSASLEAVSARDGVAQNAARAAERA
mmetsp:Transcript_10697/g.28596  ORF Transcript_10697/g.28596 Transcript_10697/m.28596 type:complete len:213 (+) Transcript_10697:553-1191(+)